MDQEVFNKVLEHLNNSISELGKARRVVKDANAKFSILDTLIIRTDEAIQRWTGRPEAPLQRKP